MSAVKPKLASGPRRILVHREGATQWDLVCDGHVLTVERVSPTAREHFMLEAFEASPDGQRLSNALTVALARAPHA